MFDWVVNAPLKAANVNKMYVIKNSIPHILFSDFVS